MAHLMSSDSSVAESAVATRDEAVASTQERATGVSASAEAGPGPGARERDSRRQPTKLLGENQFPTLIFYGDLSNAAEINAAICPAIYAWRDADPDGIVRSNVAQTASWHSGLDMASRPDFAMLADEIRAQAEKIFDSLGYDPGYRAAISNMWANIHPRHGYNRSHVHPGTLWSGVYYVQSPPQCGRIIFADPRAQAQAIRPFYRDDRPVPQSGWSEVYYAPIEGRLLLFPSWLRHEVEPNLSDRAGRAGDRISVSFNLVQERRRAGPAGA
jgi:uncharacterized protein (TIGR02466 family)